MAIILTMALRDLVSNTVEGSLVALILPTLCFLYYYPYTIDEKKYCVGFVHKDMEQVGEDLNRTSM